MATHAPALAASKWFRRSISEKNPRTVVRGQGSSMNEQATSRRRSVLLEQRHVLAAGETGVLLVPGADALFAQVPAQAHFPVVVNGGGGGQEVFQGLRSA